MLIIDAQIGASRSVITPCWCWKTNRVRKMSNVVFTSLLKDSVNPRSLS